MQLSQKKNKTTVRYDGFFLLYMRAFINIERWSFVYPPPPSPFRIYVPRLPSFCVVTKSTSLYEKSHHIQLKICTGENVQMSV